MPSSRGRSSVPSSALPCAGNLVNIHSTQKLSWIPLFHVHGRCTPSLWVTGMTRFESVDIICEIWPIRYTRSWYTRRGRLKKWLQALPPLLFPVSSHFIFVFMLSQFSGPDYLTAWNRLWVFQLNEGQNAEQKPKSTGNSKLVHICFFQIFHKTASTKKLFSTILIFKCSLIRPIILLSLPK